MATIRCGEQIFSDIQAVLFDKDGTLSNSEGFLKHLGQKRSRLVDAQVPGVQEPLLMAFGLEGDRVNPAGLLAVGSRRENEIAAAAYIAETGKDWIMARQIAHKAFQEAEDFMPRKADHTPLFSGAREALQSLANQGLQLGVITSDTPANLTDFLERHELSALIDLQMGEQPGLTKPDAIVLETACSKLGVRPANVLMVGDSAADMVMGRNAAAAGCIGVTWGWTATYTLPTADVVIHHWQDIEVMNS